MKVIDRDPPARRLALVHWLVDRWVLVIAVRCIEGQRLRSSLEARAAELHGPWRILDVEGRRGSVEAAVAALGAYVSPPTRPASADLVGVQLALFQEPKR